MFPFLLPMKMVSFYPYFLTVPFSVSTNYTSLSVCDIKWLHATHHLLPTQVTVDHNTEFSLVLTEYNLKY